MFLKITQKT